MWQVKKNGSLLLIIAFAILLIAFVIWLFNRRIKTIEKEMTAPGSHLADGFFITYKTVFFLTTINQ